MKYVSQMVSLAMSLTRKPNIVFVLGAPGAGKGTQCDLLREEQDRPNSQYSELIKYHIKNGSIVPVEAMIRSQMTNFLIDGFPRNQNNLDGWQKEMADKVTLKFVLIFDCSEENCVERCLKRGAVSGRADDNPESLHKRFKTFNESTLPIINYYKQFNLVETIDANNGPSEVFEDVKKVFAKYQIFPCCDKASSNGSAHHSH